MTVVMYELLRSLAAMVALMKPELVYVKRPIGFSP